MNYLLALLAGFVQGLTEFLPVSSTGHLIIFEKMTGISQESFGLTFDASLHLGTLLAILTFFWRDYMRALTSRKKVLLAMVAGTVPAVVFGLLFEGLIESGLRQLWIVGAALVVFSFVMMYAEKKGTKSKKFNHLNVQNALIVGLFQALALIPGISRSGSTISAGMLLGFGREDAAKFAFMLSGPIVVAAGSKKFLDVVTSGVAASELGFFIVGMISSAAFGYLTIKYFLAYLNKNGLMPFIYYRIALGVVLLVYGLSTRI